MALPSGFLNNYAYFQPGDLTTKKGLSNATNQQYELQQWQKSDTENKRGQEFAPSLQGYSDLAKGGTPQDNAALTSSVMTPLGGAYDQARTAASRRVAATGNSAGYGSFLGSLARSQGQQSAQAGFDVANEKFSRKMQGLQGLMQLYGIDTSFLTSLGQQQNATLGIGNSVQSRSKGVLGTLQGIEGLFPGLR